MSKTSKFIIEWLLIAALFVCSLYVFTLQENEIAALNRQVDSLKVVKQTKYYLQIK